MTRGTSVAIVGLGSRGLSVLERIVTLAKRAGPAAGQVRVEIIDPTCQGCGVHDPAQPDYLLLNTTCGQVSMFPDACTVGPEVDAPGPSMYEWVTGRGLRLAEDGYTVGSAGRPIRPTDFLPRRVLGEYLGWFLDQVRLRAPAHVRLAEHRTMAVDICAAPGGGLVIELADGGRVGAEHAFLTTGYTPNRDAGGRAGGGDRLIAAPYPLPAQLDRVRPGQPVAIGGFGLSAMDLVSCLTVGRGGRFVGDVGNLSYLRSGREPTLLLYSRSGVPCRARPLVTKFELKYEPLVLTPANIDGLRSARGAPLDFDQDVLPLVLTEMRIAYRRCQARCAGADAEAELARALAGAAGPAELAAVLDELDASSGRFDAAEAFDGSTGMLLDEGAAYQRWLADTIRADLAEGILGFTRSPVKAALDILRELRDTIRYVVDFGGLTSRSLDQFIGRTVPLVNRAVVGPQYERHSELLVLMAAGIAHAPFGPAPAVAWQAAKRRWAISSTRLARPCAMDADWLAAAHVTLPGIDSSASPLLDALHRKGWIRRHQPASRHVNAVDVDRDQHPLAADGRALRRLWVLGPLCEGATYYNNLVPSPRMYSRPIFDAHRCVAEMFAAVGVPETGDGRPAHPAAQPGAMRPG